MAAKSRGAAGRKAAAWDTVAIVGVGLIGGSIGLALRERGLAKRVIGVGRDSGRLAKAKRAGVVTETTTQLAAGVAQADLVVVCTPVEEVVAKVREVAIHCPETALLTDVGSTKHNIVSMLAGRPPSRANQPFRGVFIGSHPIAGSEKSGAEHSRATLFVDRTVVITPLAEDPAEQVERLEQFWKSLGARVERMTPREHDEAVAAISHLPHAIASVLAAVTPEKYLPLVAGGWLDTTRVAAGDVEMWRQILADNRLVVSQTMHDFLIKFRTFRDAVASDDRETVVRYLETGKKNRDAVGN